MLGFLKPSIMHYNNSVYHTHEAVKAVKSLVPNAISTFMNGVATATLVASSVSLFKEVSGIVVTSYALNQFIPKKFEPTIVETAINYGFKTLMTHPKEALEVTVGTVMATNIQIPFEFVKSAAKSAYNIGEIAYHSSSAIFEGAKYCVARTEEAYQHYMSEDTVTPSEALFDAMTIDFTFKDAEKDQLFNDEIAASSALGNDEPVWIESSDEKLSENWIFTSHAEIDDAPMTFDIRNLTKTAEVDNTAEYRSIMQSFFDKCDYFGLANTNNVDTIGQSWLDLVECAA